MKVLIVGAGVIGTVYGAHLAAAGNTVSVLSHGVRTDEVAAGGLSARDVLDGGRARAETAVVPDASGDYDVVLVAVRRDQMASACAGLTGLAGKPALLFFGNNPAGRSAITGVMPGDTYLGFPGVGGVMTGGTSDYVRIRQQPTALPQTSDPRLAALETALADRGFAVQRVADMDGWLAYHAAFLACIAAALFRCGTDPVRLAGDRATLTLMCQAITEAFAALRTSGTAGLPRNLAILHSPLLKAVAVRYWARTMRSPAGELCFAAHTRHAESEMRALGQDMAARITNSPALTKLLGSLWAVDSGEEGMIVMVGRLDGKVALITGAARGQGRSHAVRLAQDGADVIAVDICRQIDSVAYPLATPDDLAQTVSEVEALGRRIVATEADVRDAAALRNAVASGVARLGGVDIVVANAGIGMMSEDASEEQAFRDQIEVNLFGVWNTVQAAAPLMIEQGQGGAIVLTGSTLGLVGRGGNGHGGSDGYCASKHAIVGLGRTWAHWLAPHNIRVNSVHPAGANTPMVINEAVAKLFASAPASSGADVGNLLDVQLIEAVDVSNAIAWLVSDEARYVTGVALPVDAGFTAK